MLKIYLLTMTVLLAQGSGKSQWPKDQNGWPIDPGKGMRSEQECKSAGGKWQQVGISGYACVVSTPDAGSKCTDSAQCAGTCLAGRNVDFGAQVAGHCSETYLVWGCTAEVKNGRAQATICVD